MLKKVGIGLIVLVVVFCGVVAFQPATFQIERAATIAAPPTTVYPLLSDFHQWGAWSPWEKLDPNMTRTFEGPTSGTGAVYGWSGNKDAGTGKMTIEDATAPSLVKIKLEFIKPFAMTSQTVFDLTPVGDSTRVTWRMSGNNNFLSKAFGLFMNMDKTVGPDFEKGLAQMKAVAEAAPRTDAPKTELPR